MHTRPHHGYGFITIIAGALLTLAANAQPMPGPKATQFALFDYGNNANCAVDEFGSLRCWGANRWGMLGDGSHLNRGSPVTVVGLASGVLQVAMGPSHTCAVTTAGTAKCWGSNANGELGDGTHDDSSVPVDVLGYDNVIKIAVGAVDTCALLATNEVQCWGSVPLGPTPVSGLGQVLDIVAGNRNSKCALLASGQVACWHRYYLFVNIVPELHDATRISMDGDNRGCAVTSTGVIKCWTYPGSTRAVPNITGAVDVDSSGGRLCAVTNTGQVKCRPLTYAEDAPITIVDGIDDAVAIEIGRYHTCVMTRGGEIKCWGSNSRGELGNGHLPQSLVPMPTIALPGPMASIAMGDIHACALSKTGAARCWGGNHYGQLGDTAATDRSSPGPIVGISDGTLRQISAGWSHTCAITAAGGIQCWGKNDHGQLGDGTLADSSTPINAALPAGTIIKAVAVGDDHTCMLDTAGGVACWGANDDGQLGNGTTIDSSTPVTVTALAGARVVELTAAYKFTCALIDTGAVQCWGRNDYGQLGDGTTTSRSIPVNVAGLTDIASIRAASASICALAATGNILCWGAGGSTGLQQGPDGFDARVSTPELMPNIDDAIAVAVGRGHRCALSATGTVTCWGHNQLGQLGDGTANSSSTPVTVEGLQYPVKTISSRDFATCALDLVGQLHCWGDNGYGQLGIGGPLDSDTPVSVLGFGNWDTVFQSGFDGT